jgi:hypothetical protein
MGTTKEWGEVLLNAILFASGTLLFRRIEGKITRLAVLIYALGGLLFGVVATFDVKRVFGFPLIFLTLGIIVVALLAGRLFRLRLKRPS